MAVKAGSFPGERRGRRDAMVRGHAGQDDENVSCAGANSKGARMGEEDGCASDKGVLTNMP
jgi:hypothetical protein